MTSMTLNIDGTTLTLDEAITELRNLAYEIKYRTYNFRNGAGSREFVALQFAMRVLAEKAEAAMNEVPTYQPPEGVHGPTLGIALPDGCERLRATWDPHTASADHWLASGAAVDEYLYWWRFPPLKVGDRVQLTGTVVVAPKGGWPFVAIDGDHDDERPFPTDALTRVVTP